MQYQDGETRDINGTVYVRQGGQWRPQTNTAPTFTPISGGPRLPPPQTAPQAAKDSAEATLAGARVSMIPVEQEEARARTALAQAQAGQIGKTEDAVKLQQKRASLDSLVNQINRVEELYRQTIEPTSGLGGFLDFLPTEGNRQFDAAGAGMAEQGLAAFRVPGVGAQSDTELRQFVQANKPSASDYDVTIEEKLRQLRGRVDSTREQMGLPPAEWGGAAPPQRERADASTVYYGNPHQGYQQEIATGSTRTVANPADIGINARVNKMLRDRVPDAAIIGYLRQVGADPDKDPKLAISLRKALEFRRKNPGYKGDWSLNLERSMELPNDIVSQVGAGPVGAYFANSADALTLGTLDNMTENPELTRAAMAGLRQRNPKASLAGTVSGGVIAAGAAEYAAARAGLQGGRAALAGDAAFGAGYGAGSADDGSRLLGAAGGALAGAAGGIGGRAVVGGSGRVLTGTRDAATRYLTERGIPLTVGQMAGRGGRVGRSVKRIEDALESVPLLGDAIRARRAEGTQAFNAAAFKEALEPIPPNTVTAIGEQGVEQAQAATSGAYDKALTGVMVKADRTFARDLTRATKAGSRLHAETAEAFEVFVKNEVVPVLTSGRLSGDDYQMLRGLIRKERKGWESHPKGRAYGNALRQLEGSLESLMRRRAPDAVDGLNRADAAYRRSGVVRDAVSRGKNTGGVFTPVQLGNAAEANAKKFGGTHGTTQRPFFDLQRAGQEILPSQVPDSGTAGRLMGAGLLPALAGVGAAGQQAGYIDPGTAAIMVALGLPFTKAGQQTLQRLLVQRPELVRSVGQQVLNRRRVGGLFGAGTGASLAAQ